MKIHPISTHNLFSAKAAKSKAPVSFTSTLSYAGCGTVVKKVFDSAGNVIEKIPQKVEIYQSNCSNLTMYSYMAGGTLVGYTRVANYKSVPPQTDSPELFKDYPNQGIVGGRVVVEMMQNIYPKEYCGIGKLSDQVVIEHALKNDIPLNIISYAEMNSHCYHYLRGKRFMPVEDTVKRQKLKERYGTEDLNKIIPVIIAQTPKGVPYSTKFIGGAVIYEPKEIIAKYMQTIRQNPVLTDKKKLCTRGA